MSYIFPHISLNQRGFTLVELIVGMTVFAIWLTGILALLISTMNSASYSRHEIVVAWLLREQMELVKNIRDTNIKNYISWDRIFLSSSSSDSWTPGVYTIQNNFTTSWVVFDTGKNWWIKDSPVFLSKISLNSATNRAEIWEKTRLYFDTQSRYTHIPSGSGTAYASYIIVSPMGYTGSNGIFVPVQKDSKAQWYIIDARVIVKSAENYREYDARTAITDWIK